MTQMLDRKYLRSESTLKVEINYMGYKCKPMWVNPRRVNYNRPLQASFRNGVTINGHGRQKIKTILNNIAIYFCGAYRADFSSCHVRAI